MKLTAPPTRQDTVLVIDDAPDSLRFLTDALENSGITVLIATSGNSALELLGHVVPDLILMDAVMPGLDGFETTVRIKNTASLAHIPVIFMTGLTESEHVVEAFEVGGADYVRKPISIDELLARVRVHITNGRVVQASLAGLDATGRLMMATDVEGRFLWCTPLAEQAIQIIAPAWSKEESALPVIMRPAVDRLLSMRELPGASVKLEQPQATLEFVLIAQYRENEVLIRLNEVNPEADAAKLRLTLDLTQREAEVLLWVSYGKPNRVISDILSISPRTVNKHLERIFEKMGIETRSAAAAIAIRLICQ
ncbi:MAG TPA: DNA-binding response regulator [Sphingobium sp.]|uniref:DNA-binding response regulator n=1 Tax=Sphingobium sp. TaxID=1912891 RepID=UPI002ED53F2E